MTGRPVCIHAVDGGLVAAARELALPEHRPVLVVVGGAGKVDSAEASAIDEVVRGVVLPVVVELDAVVVDGGTDAGVMRSIGTASAAAGWGGPLVGVAVAASVGADRVPLEPHHTHVVLVAGTQWGDESAALADLAGELAGGHPTATVLLNGGAVSRMDVRHSLARGRPVIAVGTTGRLAAELAADPPDGVQPMPTGSASAGRALLRGLLTGAAHD